MEGKVHYAVWAARVFAMFALASILVRPVAATEQPRQQDEVSFLVGTISSENQWPRSYAWSMSYRNVWSDYFSTTVAYLNDGHFPGHHRDGIAGEMWAQTDLFDKRLTLAVGGGPFRYYDTTVAANGGGYSDNHGWAWLYSFDATVQKAGKPRGWFGEFRIDRTAPAKSIETTSISVGLGYRTTSDYRNPENPRAGEDLDKNEVTVALGKTVVNSFSSQESLAKGAEYRRQLWKDARLSVAFVNEGNAQLIRRSGALVEGWLEPSFHEGRASIGIGIGGYAAIDKYRPTPGRHVSAVASMTLSWRLVSDLYFRANWHRIVTNYDRDTDILLFGLGYRF